MLIYRHLTLRGILVLIKIRVGADRILLIPTPDSQGNKFVFRTHSSATTLIIDCSF